MDAEAASPPAFLATLRPNRSLSRKGLTIAISCMLLGSLSVTGMMLRLHAWPVIGFNGADLLLALFLIRLNLRAGREIEVIALHADHLEIRRTDPAGRQARLTLPPYWLNVILQERHGAVPRLLLSSREATAEIARQLGEAEKRDLAAALEAALARWRNPRFDNPQLREMRR